MDHQTHHIHVGPRRYWTVLSHTPILCLGQSAFWHSMDDTDHSDESASIDSDVAFAFVVAALLSVRWSNVRSGCWIIMYGQDVEWWDARGVWSWGQCPGEEEEAGDEMENRGNMEYWPWIYVIASLIIISFISGFNPNIISKSFYVHLPRTVSLYL